jgi:hypothetical protein
MLSALLDRPLIQNPLAGGGAPQIIDPSVITPRGGAPETDDPILQEFYNSEFYKPNAPTTMDVVNYTYQGNPMTGSSSNISQFQQYLDSIGKGNLIQRNDQIFSQETGPLATMEGQTPPGFGPQVIDQRLIDQTEFNQFPGNPNRKPADPANLPEFGRPPSMFSNTEGIGSLIGFEPIDQTFNGRQTFNNEQAFNEYVDSLVNERLKDFFGGIMGAIDV